MTNEAIKQTETSEADNDKRIRSSIRFPYLPLDDVIAVAKGVHAVSGSSCKIDQLAAHLQQAADSSNFRLKLGTSSMFGVITHSQGTVTLTPLGNRICDPQQEQAAKADAFLNVPLYAAVYEKFKGINLPPPAGLETAMVNLGVSPKQKSTARQVFHRSATLAGFFSYGPDRLVYPSIKGHAGQPATTESVTSSEADNNNRKPDRNNGSGGGGNGGDRYHPFIAGLLKTLPEADSDWPMDARRKWLQAASHIFELIYKDSESKGSLRIEVQKESAR
jgi:hypothetical protein